MLSGTLYDVIVIGAGPGGSLTGYLLSRQGLKVLIVEKKELPRYKPCAGGLTRRALNILPFDISDVVEGRSYTARISIQNKPVFVKADNHPIVTMVMRDKLDYFLVRKAIGEGTRLLDGAAFRSLSGAVGNLEVETSKGIFKTRLLVGADGVNSKVARELGWRGRRNIMTAMEGEVFYQDVQTLENLGDSVHFDFGVVPEGYGWVFPKGDHLSIGLLSSASSTRYLKPYFGFYMRMKRLDAHAEVVSLRTHLIPHGPDTINIFADQRVVLVGDAAGFSDPVTGEGIFFAIRGAQIASKVILDGLTLGHAHIEAYNDLLKKEFMREMILAKRLAYILYKFPRFSYAILRLRGRILGQYYLDVVSGTRSYSELYYKMFNPASILTFAFGNTSPFPKERR